MLTGIVSSLLNFNGHYYNYPIKIKRLTIQKGAQFNAKLCAFFMWRCAGLAG